MAVIHRHCKQQFQSTLPHGSDSSGFYARVHRYISIHAPSRERLLLVKVISPCVPISIHAPLRERPVALHVVPTLAVFQSTLPRGSDERKMSTVAELLVFQSTLPRGSDSAGLVVPVIRLYFNPRSLTGATTSVDYLINLL